MSRSLLDLQSGLPRSVPLYKYTYHCIATVKTASLPGRNSAGAGLQKFGNGNKGKDMSEEKSAALFAKLAAVEDLIREAQKGDARDSLLNAARLQLGQAICSACEITNLQPSATLSTIVEAAFSAANGRRAAAIFILRAVAVDGLLPFEADTQLARRVVELVEVGYGDQLRALKLTEKRQTFEKLTAIKGFHGSISHELDLLASPGQTLANTPRARMTCYTYPC